MIIFSIPLRNVFRNIRRTTIIFLSISAAMTAIIIFGEFIEYTFEGLKESTIRKQLGHFQIAKKGYFDQGAGTNNQFLFNGIAELEHELMHIDDIETVSRRITGSGLISVGHLSLNAMLVGVIPDKSNDLSNYGIVIDGRQLNKNNSNECVIGSLLSKGLNTKVGDIATIFSTGIDGTINAIDCDIVGIVKTSTKEYDKVYVQMNLMHLQSLLDTQKVENIVVLLKDTKSINKAEAALNKWIIYHPDFEVRKWSELADFYHSVVNLYTSIFKLSSLVLGIIITLGITNTMSMSVFERFREIGTIRAIGQTRAGIIINFLFEGAMIGVLGGILGIIIGILTAYAINYSGGINIPPPPGMSLGYTAYINLNLRVMANAFLLSVIVSTLSSIYPAIIATKKDIIEALTHT